LKIHLSDLLSYRIQGPAVLPHKITGLWFDTTSWIVRYLRIENAGERFLLPTSALGRSSEQNKTLTLRNPAEILRGLTIFSGDSISRDFERQFLSGMNLPCYWEGEEESIHRNYTSMIQSAEASIQDDGLDLRESDHFHLAHSDQFSRSRVLGTNGAIGELADFVLTLDSWSLSCFLVEMLDSSKRIVLIDPEWIDRWIPRRNEIQIDLAKEIILLEAVYDPRKEGDKRYEIDV